MNAIKRLSKTFKPSIDECHYKWSLSNHPMPYRNIRRNGVCILKIFILLALLMPSLVDAQIISTIAGTGVSGHTGDGGSGILAKIAFPTGGACDRHGNYYFPERTMNRVRKIAQTGIISTVAGTGSSGFSGDNGLAINATLKSPTDVVCDSAGNIFIADKDNYRIRKIDVITGVITTICGIGIDSYGGDNGPSASASLAQPTALAMCNEALYIVGGNRVRKIDQLGIITTVAGNGINGFSGDGGLADTATLNSPGGIFVDQYNNIFIADGNNHRVRKVDHITNIISTVAGDGTTNFNGDEILAVNSAIDPFDVAADKIGNLYIADHHNNRIRMVDISGSIHTVVGTGTQGYSGDGHNADSADIYGPEGIALDTCGNLYIADWGNNRIRKVVYDSTCGVVDTTDTATAVHNVEQSHIDVYPNPAKELVIVAGGSNVKDLVVMNAMGQIVMEEKYDSYKAVVDVSRLMEGVYYILVWDEKGKVERMKFVKE